MSSLTGKARKMAILGLKYSRSKGFLVFVNEYFNANPGLTKDQAVLKTLPLYDQLGRLGKAHYRRKAHSSKYRKVNNNRQHGRGDCSEAKKSATQGHAKESHYMDMKPGKYYDPVLSSGHFSDDSTDDKRRETLHPNSPADSEGDATAKPKNTPSPSETLHYNTPANSEGEVIGKQENTPPLKGILRRNNPAGSESQAKEKQENTPPPRGIVHPSSPAESQAQATEQQKSTPKTQKKTADKAIEAKEEIILGHESLHSDNGENVIKENQENTPPSSPAESKADVASEAKETISGSTEDLVRKIISICSHMKAKTNTKAPSRRFLKPRVCATLPVIQEEPASISAAFAETKFETRYHSFDASPSTIKNCQSFADHHYTEVQRGSEDNLAEFTLGLSWFLQNFLFRHPYLPKGVARDIALKKYSTFSRAKKISFEALALGIRPDIIL